MEWGSAFEDTRHGLCLAQKLVPLARLERALPKKTDFESVASTNSATGALREVAG